MLLFYFVLLILPITALIARRVPTASLLKMGLIWIAIFGVGAAIFYGINHSNFT